MSTEPENNKQLHFGFLLFISLVLFNLSFILDQTIRWSNHSDGFMNGIKHTPLISFFWCFTTPWLFITLILYRHFKWRRYRTLWNITPSLLIIGYVLINLITKPPTPRAEFLRFTNVELPNDAKNIQYHYSGGGFAADPLRNYYFESSKEAVYDLIQTLKLEEAQVYHDLQSPDSLFYDSYQLTPNPSTWKGITQYRLTGDQPGWFCYLITNEAYTKVCLIVGAY